ncbi:MAG: peroxide stress protein YaaA [Flavobacteriales bacterium]|nr:peroxide stress protein YaaA [Flavobacteriales bacterium]
MLILLSPAKKLDFSPLADLVPHTLPDGLERSSQLMSALRKLSVKQIRELMDLSEDLAYLNRERYAAWESDFTQGELKQALLAFNGDVYQGLDAASMSVGDLDFAQQHLRILSGLHGLLRPLDLIRPHRLEMGTRLSVRKSKSLYDFWGDSITESINAQLSVLRADVVVNLASAEYFKAVKAKKLNAQVITPSFKDYKNGQLKSLFLYVKQARGMMSGFAIRNRITDAEDLKDFEGGGYRFTQDLSDADNWVFTR